MIVSPAIYSNTLKLEDVLFIGQTLSTGESDHRSWVRKMMERF